MYVGRGGGGGGEREREREGDGRRENDRKYVRETLRREKDCVCV